MNKWENNKIQFPRLLAEINAVGLFKKQIEGLCDSMDLTKDEIQELFERAEIEFEKEKRNFTS